MSGHTLLNAVLVLHDVVCVAYDEIVKPHALPLRYALRSFSKIPLSPLDQFFSTVSVHTYEVVNVNTK